MKGYFIRSSRVTPSVYFNPGKKLLDIRGRSSPENPIQFYNYINSSIEDYVQKQKSALIVNMAFEYFNTSSSKCIFNVLKKLDEIGQSGNTVSINWFYETEDDDMMETGEDLSSFFNLAFNFVEVPEIKTLGDEKPDVTDKSAA